MCKERIRNAEFIVCNPRLSLTITHPQVSVKSVGIGTYRFNGRSNDKAYRNLSCDDRDLVY